MKLARGHRGSTLIAIMVVAGVLSAAIYAYIQQRGSRDRNRQLFRLLVAKDRVQLLVSRYSKMPASLRNSLTHPENSALLACVTAGPACGVPAHTPFRLYGPSPDSPAIGGSVNAPVFYDQFGQECVNAPDADPPPCPLQVLTDFTWAPAAGGSITISYLIQKAPKSPFPGQVELSRGNAPVKLSEISFAPPPGP